MSKLEITKEQSAEMWKAAKDGVDTYQRCGLLPSGLLRQRDELREALIVALEVMKPYNDLYNAAAERNAIKIAGQALKNSER